MGGDDVESRMAKECGEQCDFSDGGVGNDTHTTPRNKHKSVERT